MDAKWGNRNVAKMVRQVEQLRRMIREQGTPDIQEAWDKLEEHIDYAYRRKCENCAIRENNC